MQPIYQSDRPRRQQQANLHARPHAQNSKVTPGVPGTFLDLFEIHSLTARTRRHAQVKVLRSMGIEHKVRPDGGIAVLRAHIAKVFDGGADAAPRHRTEASPNWLAI
ncbi:MAG: hypothetical protein CVU22_00915 [Betaproteobacteria bacterium HGW-Betaproteobacteria-16]|nr:MAG: hypothetical protein CVU22_00915 [Betaproteobacteria bacterium HGW-Betaproteobacteria-16]